MARLPSACTAGTSTIDGSASRFSWGPPCSWSWCAWWRSWRWRGWRRAGGAPPRAPPPSGFWGGGPWPLGTAFLVLDAVMAGPAMRLPLLGGTAFDGGRFYGLPNAFIALLLSGTVFLAAWTTRVRGVVLLAAAGLFAGFP